MWRENCWKPKTNYKSKNNLMRITKFSHPFPTGILRMAIGLTLWLTNGSVIKIRTSWKCYFKKIKQIKRLIKPLGLAVTFSILINQTKNTNHNKRMNPIKLRILWARLLVPIWNMKLPFIIPFKKSNIRKNSESDFWDKLKSARRSNWL